MEYTWTRKPTVLTTSSSIAVSWSTWNDMFTWKLPATIHSSSDTWYVCPPKITLANTTMLKTQAIPTSTTGTIQDR